MKPRIKDGVSVLFRTMESGDIELNFLVEVTSTIVTFQVDRNTLNCVRLFDGKHTVEEISKQTGVSSSAISQLSAALEAAHVLETNARQRNDYQGTRFETQAHFFSGFESEQSGDIQQKIGNASVVIIGAGGIGTWVAYGLVIAGVSNLTLVDPDTVELSNLNRQALFATDVVGHRKVTALRHKLQQFERELDVREVTERILSVEACTTIVAYADLVICCADEPGTDEINRIVSQSCYPGSIPHILCGGYDGHLGFVGPTIVPGESGCWFCYEQTLEHQLLSAGYEHLLITTAHVKGGNLGAISAIIANYHVLEALKVIGGFAKPTLVNQVAEIDFLTHHAHLRPYRQLKECPICSK